MYGLEIVRIPARLSRTGATELYCSVVPGSWQDRAKHLQQRRWRHLRATMGDSRCPAIRRKERHETYANLSS
jgi:hypothetical protein